MVRGYRYVLIPLHPPRSGNDQNDARNRLPPPVTSAGRNLSEAMTVIWREGFCHDDVVTVSSAPMLSLSCHFHSAGVYLVQPLSEKHPPQVARFVALIKLSVNPTNINFKKQFFYNHAMLFQLLVLLINEDH